MDAPISQEKRLLLVSDDRFVQGFVNGQCQANHVQMHSTTPERLPDNAGVLQRYALVVLDCRNSSVSRHHHDGDEQLQRFKSRVGDASPALCVIFDSLDTTTDWQRFGVTYLVEEPIADRLGACFRQHFGEATPILRERRKGDRRKIADRRRLPIATEFTPNTGNEKPVLGEPDTGQLQHIGPFAVDHTHKIVYLRGRNLELTAKEYRLFMTLSSDTSRVFSAPELIAALWPHNDRANKSDLYQYMHLLRKKVELDHYNPRLVVTVKGVGYQLRLPRTPLTTLTAIANLDGAKMDTEARSNISNQN